MKSLKVIVKNELKRNGIVVKESKLVKSGKIKGLKTELVSKQGDVELERDCYKDAYTYSENLVLYVKEELIEKVQEIVDGLDLTNYVESKKTIFCENPRINEEDFKDYLEVDLFKESIEYNKSKYDLKELVLEIDDMDNIIIDRKGYEVAFIIESNIDFR